jgi:serine protease Do
MRARLPVVLVGALLLIGTLAGAAPAGADEEPAPLSSRRLFDQARPGVELITVQFSAGLVVPEAIVTEANGRALEAIAADRIRRGEIPATQAAARGAIIDEMSRDPFRWFTASSRVHRTSVKLAATGSGFSITPDGYIVTNAHVVAPKSEDITAALIAQDLRGESDEFIAGFQQDGLTQAQATRFLNALVRWATRNATLANFKRTISVVASTGGGSGGSSGRRVARLVAAGEEFPGKDVAVLKIRARNMATVPLGDDSALSTGDRLFVLGFPGAATFNPVLSRDSQKEPTLTQGVLSAKKQVKGGYTVLQTDAGMTHGNSGGPVFDERGRVVGIATLGSVDPNTGREVSGLNFAVPTAIVNDLLRDAHVRASEGAAGRAYRQALDDIDRHWYKRTLPLLQRVKALDPGHPLVAKLIKDSQTAIAQGRDRTPREFLGVPVLVAGGAAAAVVVAGAGGGLLAARSRRRRRRQPVHATRPAFEPATHTAASANGWASAPEARGWAAAPEPNGWAARPEANGWGATPEPNGWAPASEASGWGAAPEPDQWTAAPGPDGWGAAPEPATQPLDLSPPAAGGHGDAWWQDLQPQPPAWTEPAAPPARPAPAALQSWWQAEEAQDAEVPAQTRPEPQPQPGPGVACWNCGRHNHPSLHYCEHCWTVLR